ncbi:MAG: ROK family protein [Lachnospiraceae bacterium]|nr:ROK family protein [Lachnospiraceae bacterium]
MNYLTMDFGGTLVKYSIMDEALNVLLRDEAPAPISDSEAYYGFVVRLAGKLRKEFDLKGAALSMPGVIDAEKGVLVGSGAYYRLAGQSVTEEIERRTGLPASMENDGKCGVLAEVWKGNLSDVDNGVVIILGTAVAGGIVLNRKLLKGRDFSAGEFSYSIVGEERGFECTAFYHCGVSTLLHKACIAKGIDVRKLSIYPMMGNFKLFQDQTEFSELNDLPEYAEGMDGRQFFDFLRAGDPAVEEIYRKYVFDVARLAMNETISFDPERILIGGGISRQDRLIEDIRTEYDFLRTICGGSLFKTEISRCRYMNEANQYGALYHFLNMRGEL